MLCAGLEAGSRVGSVQANDIDSHPHLFYTIQQGGNPRHAFRQAGRPPLKLLAIYEYVGVTNLFQYGLGWLPTFSFRIFVKLLLSCFAKFSLN